MEQFRIEVADFTGLGQIFDIRTEDNEHYQIYNDRQERMATIEIDRNEPQYFRQNLNCRLALPILDSIKESILLHEEVEAN
ncbi:hypothetical protein ACXZ1K_14175 [Pedobacter sp. PWIIR3]